MDPMVTADPQPLTADEWDAIIDNTKRSPRYRHLVAQGQKIKNALRRGDRAALLIMGVPIDSD